MFGVLAVITPGHLSSFFNYIYLYLIYYSFILINTIYYTFLIIVVLVNNNNTA